MAKGKVYTGVVLEDDFLKVAKISVSGKQIKLLKLDRVSLVSPLEKKVSKQANDVLFDSIQVDDLEDSIFDLDNLDFDDTESDSNDLSFDLDFEDEESQDELIGDMTFEAGDESSTSNEMVMYNILNSIGSKSATIGLNMPAGSTVYQILKDVDFTQTKRKDLKIIIDDRLESIYGSPKSKDHFSYTVRDDGSLLLASTEDEPKMIELVNKSSSFYSGKIIVNDVIPDEILLVGLIRQNYEIDENSISCVVQYSEKACRILFLKGTQLWIVSPLITEGTKNKKFLNTIFSKILFQLDTGEVPNLDRVILCNNSLGTDAVEFFKSRFPDVEVSEFELNEDIVDTSEVAEDVIPSFTTAIAMAIASSGFEKDKFPKISFLPSYISDRQKIFKLQWHGYLLLFLILFIFPAANYFYNINQQRINSLTTESNQISAEIASLEPIVNEYNRATNELSSIQGRLTLLDELSQNTLTWSTNFDILNRGFNDINSVWITSFVQASNSDAVELQGIALFRNRIPLVANVFNKALLINVSTITIRDREVYSFRYQISNFVSNSEVYTPESIKGIKEILGN